MSDFDKEAERERLREQFESEESQRETTERMSELLLKGATMTNAHCGTCGDPIFRYEGQEFCPTCQEVVTEDDTAEASQHETAAEAEPAENGTSPDAGTEADDAAVPGDGDTADTGPATETTAESEPSDLPERRAETLPDRDRYPSEPPRRPEPPARREESARQSTDAAAAGDDLADARDSLRRTLVRFAREAERCEDPRRATEHLEAAHEAADTLAAMSEIR